MPKTVIPFGPQHPILHEPLQLKLVMQDERVIEAIPSMGYVHRGIEKLVETKEFIQNIHIVERICGNCSCMNAMAYCQGMESLMDIQIPDRAKYLRVIWAELNRMHSHLLGLGLLADSLGFESLRMQLWRKREKVLDIMEETAGSRLIISVNTIGGTKRDISREMLLRTNILIEEIVKDMREIEQVFLEDYTIRQRLTGVGVLTKNDAYKLGAVGPVARASGINQDIRITGYAAYGELDFEPVVLNDGDSYSRTVVRMKEIYQSIRMICQAIEKIPEGEISVPVKGSLKGEAITRVEQSKGEVMFFIKANGTVNLERMRIRTPAFANLPALMNILQGSELSNVPMLIMSIDPCISCMER